MQQVDCVLLEQPGAHALLDVRAIARLQHHALDPGLAQEQREGQAGRTGSDDAHLCLHGLADPIESSNKCPQIAVLHTMAEIASLSDAVASLVSDGDAVALEGFTHLIPFAAGHELLRQRRRDLELIRMTPDVLYDQMIGAGAARKLVFSYGGNPGVGSLHRFRDAIENDWPNAIEIEEHPPAGMANRFAAGAAALPLQSCAATAAPTSRRARA